ncbi:MAG: hypothetical protein WKF43_17865, partial [Acidimicrobiales bacterium]
MNRARPASLLALTLLAGLASAVLSGPLAAAARPALVTRSVTVTVDFSPSTRQTFTVAFEEGHLTGLEVLQRTGLALGTWGTGAGTAICRIGAVGRDPGPDCLGQGSDPYWAYFRDGKYSSVGAGSSRVEGGVEQWRWGTGSTPPPLPVPTTTTTTTTSTPMPTASTSPRSSTVPSSPPPSTPSPSPGPV